MGMARQSASQIPVKKIKLRLYYVVFHLIISAQEKCYSFKSELVTQVTKLLKEYRLTVLLL